MNGYTVFSNQLLTTKFQTLHDPEEEAFLKTFQEKEKMH